MVSVRNRMHLYDLLGEPHLRLTFYATICGPRDSEVTEVLKIDIKDKGNLSSRLMGSLVEWVVPRDFFNFLSDSS